MKKLFHHFYRYLPIYQADADEHLHVLNDREIRQIRRYERALITVASLMSIIGFFIYYLPVYWWPELFPRTTLALPWLGTVPIPWAESIWCIVLTAVELVLLMLLNIAGVHAISIATGFVTEMSRSERSATILQIGLEAKPRQIVRYGIDPLQGLNKWALFLFNAALRLRGWFGNRLIRFLVRLVLGRYAVRTVLDFAGLPIYMAINAISVRTVLREARVIIMGQAVIVLVMRRLPPRQLSSEDKTLLYDTLQYIAVSKRDFHENHFVLTRNLMAAYGIPVEPEHPLPDDYLQRLGGARPGVAQLCKLVILLGFILDGQVSIRERFRLRHLNRHGILTETFADLKRYARSFLAGAGIEPWSDCYVSRIEADL